MLLFIGHHVLDGGHDALVLDAAYGLIRGNALEIGVGAETLPVPATSRHPTQGPDTGS